MTDVVVVGVDGSAGSDAALEFGLREAVARGAVLEMVTAWLWTSPFPGMSETTTIDRGREIALVVQSEALRRTGGASARVTQIAVHDFAGKALVARADQATLLVVGSGRRDVVAPRPFGSVREYCVRHASVPVAVVPARAERPKAS